MKPIHPLDEYQEERGYPALAEVDSERRAALGRLLGGAVAGGAVLLGGLGNALGASEKGKGYHAHTFTLVGGSVQVHGCRYSVSRLLVQSKDQRLITFVKAAKERAGIDGVFRKVLARAKCSDFTDQRRLATLQRKLGTALAKHYRARRRRGTPRPLITLHLGPLKRRYPLPPGLPPHP